MKNSLSTSNFKRLPWALIIFLMLLIPTEMLIDRLRFEFINHVWTRVYLAKKDIFKVPSEWIVIGDSRTLTGVNPSKVSPGMLNLSFPAFQPMGYYLVLKNYLEQNPAPKGIFFSVHPEIWKNLQDCNQNLLKYFMSFKDFREVWPDLTWQERLTYLKDLLPSYRDRIWFQKNFEVSAGLIESRYAGYEMGDVVKTGFMPSPHSEKALGPGIFSKSLKKYHSETFKTYDRNLKYFDKFIQLAHERGIQLYFFEQLTPEELYQIREESGFNHHYRNFIQELLQRYPGWVEYVNGNELTLPNKYFVDSAHLNQGGAVFFTNEFKEKIFQPAVRSMN